MSRAKNLAGQRFGNIVAVEPTPRRKNGYTLWKCLCDCGRIIEAPSRYLKNGWTTVCGDPDCAYSQQSAKMHVRGEDLTGQRFGKLTVRKMLPERGSAGQIMWDCICDCGKTIAAPTGQLKAGYRKSCGCLSRPPLKDWIGQRFGMLEVIAYDGKRTGKHFWKCKCDCGNEVSVCQSNLKSGHTISCGCQNKPYEARTIVEGTCLETIRNAVEKKTIAKNNSSGVRGVYKNKRTGRWCAQITFQGKTKYLGSFETLREATLARERGMEIFQEFLDRYNPENTVGQPIKDNNAGNGNKDNRKTEQTDYSATPIENHRETSHEAQSLNARTFRDKNSLNPKQKKIQETEQIVKSAQTDFQTA